MLYDCRCLRSHANSNTLRTDKGRAETGRLTRIVPKSRQRGPLFPILCSACQLQIRVGWAGLREYSALSYYTLQTLQRGQRPRVSPPPALQCLNYFTAQIWVQQGRTHEKKEKSLSYLARIYKNTLRCQIQFPRTARDIVRDTEPGLALLWWYSKISTFMFCVHTEPSFPQMNIITFLV